MTQEKRDEIERDFSPALYCASCGATTFQRLYKGGGEDWLHDADDEGSAACGPVLASPDALLTVVRGGKSG